MTLNNNPHACLSLVLVAFLSALSGCRTSGNKESRTPFTSAQSVQVFRGAWFEVAYPASFTPVPSLRSSTGEGYDSIAFESPDGRVSFYIYAPQWGGEPTDIALDPMRESLVSDKKTEKNGRTVRWLTICAKDGSYCRAYQDTIAQQGSLRTTLGIRYRDEKARRQYHQDYLNFRDSLVQFTD
jgi:hypothetical protein